MNQQSKAVAVRQELTPQTWDMLTGVAKVFYKSNKMSLTSADEGTVKVLFCLENGLPLTAARGLFFVNGKLGIESGVIAAMLRQHPDYDYKIVRLDDMGCTIEITRFGEPVGEASFTQQDAERAGLAGKHNYKAYPEDMFFAKAITRAQRRLAPDVFGAPVYAQEEMGDWVDAEVVKPSRPTRGTPPTHAELIDKFGANVCLAAGMGEAVTENDMWALADKLSIIAASDESAQADQVRAEEPAPTVAEMVEDVESPFSQAAS